MGKKAFLFFFSSLCSPLLPPSSLPFFVFFLPLLNPTWINVWIRDFFFNFKRENCVDNITFNWSESTEQNPMSSYKHGWRQMNDYLNICYCWKSHSTNTIQTQVIFIWNLYLMISNGKEYNSYVSIFWNINSGNKQTISKWIWKLRKYMHLWLFKAKQVCVVN